MKKILVISNTSFSIEKFRSHYLNRLNKNKDILVTTPYQKPKNLLGPRFKSLRSRNIVSEFLKINKIIKNFNPDLILAYSWKMQLLLTFLNISKDIRKIYLIAGRGSILNIKNTLLKNLVYILLNKILSNCDQAIFINPDDKKFFGQRFKLNTSYLLPTEGLKVTKFKKKKNLKKNFIFFARIIQSKGIIDYIKVAEKLKKRNKNLNFYLAGPLDKSLIGQSNLLASLDYKNNIKNLLTNKNVKYLGYIQDYKKIFPKIDCLVAPSFNEGAGTSVMEAMISGLFVIGYKNSGHNYVTKGTNNFLCNKNNTNYLEKNILKFLKCDEKFLNKNSLISYKKVRNNFSSNIVSKKIEKILDDNFHNSLSIIVATYKRPFFLKKKLDEARNAKDIDYVFIFENDDTVSIKLFKSYKNNNIHKYISNAKNLDSAISLGIQKAKSKYILIHGDDDYIEMGNIKKIKNTLFLNYDVIHYGSNYFNYQNKRAKKIRRTSILIKKFMIYFFSNKFIILFNYFNTPALVIKKEYLISKGGYPTNFKYGSDYLLWQKFSDIKVRYFNIKLSEIYYDRHTISGKYSEIKNKYIYKKLSYDQSYLIRILQNFFLKIKNLNDKYLNI